MLKTVKQRIAEARNRLGKSQVHVVTCKWAKKIAPSNAVYYTTREEAIQDGHRPCKQRGDDAARLSSDGQHALKRKRLAPGCD